MSQGNVELVRGRVWDGIDAFRLLRDDAAFAEWRAENEAFYEPDRAFAWIAFGHRLEATGLGDARRTWLDFFEPWKSVHSKIEGLIPAGDKVVGLMRQRGRMPGARREVPLIGAALYLVRDGRIAHGTIYQAGLQLHQAEAPGGPPWGLSAVRSSMRRPAGCPGLAGDDATRL